MFFKFIVILFSHYVLDYPLQGDFLASTKGKYWYSLLAHSMIYGLGMTICFKIINCYADWKVFVLVISHFIIDYYKATAKNKEKALTTYLYIDQGLHNAINLLLAII
jgi:hypothetical protein